ncbi:MAG: hypothetical protein C0478_14695 [Planctomyces sp.]|nr:hypothetical protein [Planctomyces sp.]
MTIVSGQATMDGEPLTGMAIQFYEPRLGQGMVANLDASGRFRSYVPITLGTYEIALRPRQPDSTAGPEAPIASPLPPKGVPKLYLNPNTSGIRVTVTETKDTFDIAFSKDGPEVVRDPKMQLRSFRQGE